jgi:hypothetical protein
VGSVSEASGRTDATLGNRRCKDFDATDSTG